ncbi:MAG: hypothetical protein GJU73_02660 [Ferrovum sp.]|nr:hypothetical protein [Ferrovum sp.]
MTPARRGERPTADELAVHADIQRFFGGGRPAITTAQHFPLYDPQQTPHFPGNFPGNFPNRAVERDGCDYAVTWGISAQWVV